jgi:tetratricopeptide (TPR) repeat protein
MAHSIFISLTQQDTPIAEALRHAIRRLLGDTVQVHFSTSKELSGGIRHGQDWFDWIVERVQQCDFAFILVTPASVQKPWILWEAGAVQGAAVASGGGDLRRVRPLVYDLESADLPSPIRDSKVQFRRGDRAQDVDAMLTEIVDQYRDDLPMDRVKAAFRQLDEVVAEYLDAVRESLLTAPSLPTSPFVEEWRARFGDLLAQGRYSEVEQLHDWMDVAFGRERDERPQPLDLLIHNRLADLYLKSRNYRRAIEQLQLARQLAPRDIFVLRRLGKALLDDARRDEAKAVIDRIASLDKAAVVRNAECAALAGRWYREGRDLARAIEIFRDALGADRESYYLANLLGETQLEASQLDGARESFAVALDIIGRLREQNVWTRATPANARFVLGDDDRAAEHLREIAASGADAGSVASVEAGLHKIAAHVDRGGERLVTLLRALRS